MALSSSPRRLLTLAQGWTRSGSRSANTFRWQESRKQKNLRTQSRSTTVRPPQGTSLTVLWYWLWTWSEGHPHPGQAASALVETTVTVSWQSVCSTRSMSIPSGKGRKGDPSICHHPEKAKHNFALLSGVYHSLSLKHCSPNVREIPNIIDKNRHLPGAAAPLPRTVSTITNPHA